MQSATAFQTLQCRLPAPRSRFSVLCPRSSVPGSGLWPLCSLFFVLCSPVLGSRFWPFCSLFFVLCSPVLGSRFSVLGSFVLCSLFFVLGSRTTNHTSAALSAVSSASFVSSAETTRNCGLSATNPAANKEILDSGALWAFWILDWGSGNPKSKIQNLKSSDRAAR